MRKWGIVILSGIVFSCSSTKNKKTVDNHKNSSPYIVTVNTSPCFGSCSFYTMVINQNRTATYEGFRYPKTNGVIEKELPQFEVDSLRLVLAENNFSSLDSIYDNTRITDLPSITIQLDNKKGSKSVTGRFDTPQSFNNISAFIERLRIRNFDKL